MKRSTLEHISNRGIFQCDSCVPKKEPQKVKLHEFNISKYCGEGSLIPSNTDNSRCTEEAV
jgi:hypothetical protein